MATKYPIERTVIAGNQVGEKGIYHEPLLDHLPTWRRIRHQGSYVEAVRLDLVRFLPVDHLDQMTTVGDSITSEEARGNNIVTKRGKLPDPKGGIQLQSGLSIQLPPDLLESIAHEHFQVEQSFGDRSQFILPQDITGRIASKGDSQSWEEIPEQAKKRHYQKAYELSIALALLQRAAPQEHASITDSSITLSDLTKGKNTPALLKYPADFQERFCRDNKDFAWAWRNMLEPGKEKVVRPTLSEKDILFRNQMGLGTLEYLSVIGQEAIDYLRNFGQAMRQHPFQRTEIQDLSGWLPGVPLQGGTYLRGSPELFIFLARENHELWRFNRELSWILEDSSFHQPPRKEHKPWKDLKIETMNRDVLASFGVCFLLALMPDEDFKLVREAATIGNPMNFPLTDFEVS